MVRIDWQLLLCESLLTLDRALHVIVHGLLYVADGVNNIRMPILRYIERKYAP
jgi:hypothetical protein